MKRKMKFFLPVLVMLLLFFMNPKAQQVVDLTTGVDAYWGLIPIGTMDPKWSIDRPDSPGLLFQPIGCGNGGLNNGISNYFPFSLCANGRWLSHRLDANGFTLASNSPAGIYTYQMTFLTPQCVVTSDTFFLDCIGADNSVTSIAINGHVFPIGTLNCTWVSDTIPLQASDINVGGLNTIRVEVYNQGIYTGLMLDGSLGIHYDLGCPLPVVYASALAVETINQHNQLSWATSQEINSKWFAIERSVDLKSGFETIGHLNATGHSEVITEYAFADSSFSKGQNYYRIRQIDENGTAVLSEVVVADNRSKVEEFRVWPNPTNGLLHFHLAPNMIIQVGLFDMTGNVAGEYSLISPAIGYEGVADLHALARGNYVLIAHDQEGSLVKRMILRKE